eukprot:gene9175-10128_t
MAVRSWKTLILLVLGVAVYGRNWGTPVCLVLIASCDDNALQIPYEEIILFLLTNMQLGDNFNLSDVTQNSD